MLATASAVSRANMATSDWLRRFDFDRVFWSTPSQPDIAREEEDGSANKHATQESIFEGLGERIVEDALNVSYAVAGCIFGGMENWCFLLIRRRWEKLDAVFRLYRIRVGIVTGW